MAGKTKRSALDRELDELRPALENPDLPASHALLRSGLKSARSFVVAKAAAVVRDRSLEGFEADLQPRSGSAIKTAR